MSRGVKEASPPHGFVDLLGLMIAFLLEPGVRTEGISVASLEAMLKDVMRERARDEKQERAFSAAHAEFTRRQSARWGQYMEVLDTLRARYRRNPAILKRLKALQAPHKPKKQDEAKAPSKVAAAA